MTHILPSQRDLFEIPDDVVYLNAAAYVPLPRAVREAGEHGVLTKSHPWNMGREQGNAEAERARRAAAGPAVVAARFPAAGETLAGATAAVVHLLHVFRGTL